MPVSVYTPTGRVHRFQFLHISACVLSYFFLFIYLSLPEDMFALILEAGEEGEEGTERNISGREKHPLIDGDRTCNPGFCSDWESNP